MKQDRLLRAESISKKIVSEYIIMEFPELWSEHGIITVVDVKISSDLGYMDVFVSALNNIDTLTKSLSEHAHNLHRSLWKKIDFIKVPKIRFRYDDSGKDSFEIYNTIKSLDI